MDWLVELRGGLVGGKVRLVGGLMCGLGVDWGWVGWRVGWMICLGEWLSKAVE